MSVYALAGLALTLAAVFFVLWRRERASGVIMSEITEALPGGFVLWDSHDRLVRCNRAYVEAYPLCSDILKPGVRFEDFIRTGVSRGQFPQAEGREEDFVREALATHEGQGQSTERQLLSGRWLLVTEQRTRSGGIVAIRSEITAFKRALAMAAEAHDVAQHMAHHDGLTGLANRVPLQAALRRGMDAHNGVDTTLAVMCLDLDLFKRVNDVHGHAGGDELLTMVAARIRACLQEGDLAARVGGDEFVIVLCARDARAAAKALALRLIHRLGKPYDLTTGRARIGVSVGASIFDGSCDGDELLRRADAALYSAKRAGRATYREARSETIPEFQAA